MSRWDGLTYEQRLNQRLREASNGCIEWTGPFIRGGYGAIYIDGKKKSAHRALWELTYGAIAEGLFVLHACDNPPCCNLAHLRLGTHVDNMADRAARGRVASGSRNLTHCKRGHAFTEENTYIWRTSKYCRTCMKDRSHTDTTTPDDESGTETEEEL